MSVPVVALPTGALASPLLTSPLSCKTTLYHNVISSKVTINENVIADEMFTQYEGSSISKHPEIFNIELDEK